MLIKSCTFVVLFFVLATNYRAQIVTISESPQKISIDRDRGISMLEDLKEILKDNYYDKTFHGINLDERFKKSKEFIKTANSNSEIFSEIAGILLDFNDSHTLFYPPNRAYSVEYGFTMQLIGDKCFITSVKKGTDAEKKGLHAGDEVVLVGRYIPTFENLWKINYLIYQLAPQPAISLTLRDKAKTERLVTIESKFTSMKERRKLREKQKKKKREDPYKCVAANSETIACRLETFVVEKKYIDKMMQEVGDHKNFILDLRSNGGGLVSINEYLTGFFFDKEIEIAKFVMRDKTKITKAKPHGDKNFKGNIFVLIDSRSASASEMFARTIQLNGRGKVIGDVSAGAVMMSSQYVGQNVRGVPGFQSISLFAANITRADVIMPDGKRLEKVGVMPDFPVGPTALALYEGSDPILAYAIGKAGTTITGKEAAAYKFLVTADEDEDAEETGDE